MSDERPTRRPAAKWLSANSAPGAAARVLSDATNRDATLPPLHPLAWFAQPEHSVKLRRSHSDDHLRRLYETQETPTIRAPLRRRRHTFSGSRRAVEHREKKQRAEKRARGRSQTLFALRWPLPLLTKSIALLTALVSLVSNQSASSLRATCVAPVQLLSEARLADIANVHLAPLLAERSVTDVSLAVSNVLLLGLLESETKATTMGQRMAAAWATTIGIRLGLGFAFSRGTGWAYPQLFSSSAAHECSAGLGPIMVALALQHVYTPTHARSYAVQLGRRRLELPRSAVHVALAALNIALVPTAWWHMSAVLAGLALVLARALGSRSKHLGRALLLGLVAVMTIGSLAYTRHAFAQPGALQPVLAPGHDQLLSIVLLTAPRPDNPDFLSDTLGSYLASINGAHHQADLLVYNNFASHAAYNNSVRTFSDDTRAKISWIADATDADDRVDQRLHLARAISHALAHTKSSYIMLAEDDFPLCDPTTQSWSKLLTGLAQLQRVMPDRRSTGQLGHCGLFVGTGGAGLIIRREIAQLLPALLLGSDDPHGHRRMATAFSEIMMASERPPDLVIQDCLRGQLPECAAMCGLGDAQGGEERTARDPFGVRGSRHGKVGLAVTERLLMHHLGYERSTIRGRSYPASWAQCGQRHPFVRSELKSRPD